MHSLVPITSSRFIYLVRKVTFLIISFCLSSYPCRERPFHSIGRFVGGIHVGCIPWLRHIDVSYSDPWTVEGLCPLPVERENVGLFQLVLGDRTFIDHQVCQIKVLPPLKDLGRGWMSERPIRSSLSEKLEVRRFPKYPLLESDGYFCVDVVDFIWLYWPSFRCCRVLWLTDCIVKLLILRSGLECALQGRGEGGGGVGTVVTTGFGGWKVGWEL